MTKNPMHNNYVATLLKNYHITSCNPGIFQRELGLGGSTASGAQNCDMNFFIFLDCYCLTATF